MIALRAVSIHIHANDTVANATLSFQCVTVSPVSHTPSRTHIFLHSLFLYWNSLMPFYRQYFQFHIEFLLKIIEWNVNSASEAAAKIKMRFALLLCLYRFVIFARLFFGYNTFDYVPCNRQHSSVREKKLKNIFRWHAWIWMLFSCETVLRQNAVTMGVDKNVQNKRADEHRTKKKSKRKWVCSLCFATRLQIFHSRMKNVCHIYLDGVCDSACVLAFQFNNMCK